MRGKIGRLFMISMMALFLSTQATANIELIRIENGQVVGSGKLEWLGMTVYAATLYAPEGSYRPNQPHAIRIDYQFSFSRKQLAGKSLDEIERIYGKQPDRRSILESLESVFQDVRKGDHIVGVHYPGEQAEFYSGDKLLGRLEDPSLASAFFDIWLDPRTSRPSLRAELLGGR